MFMTLDEVRKFQSLAREAISIYDNRIAFYSDILDKLQAIINKFDGGGNK